jgi:hypothetical protein
MISGVRLVRIMASRMPTRPEGQLAAMACWRRSDPTSRISMTVTRITAR